MQADIQELTNTLKKFTLIWDQEEDCFHCPFQHRIGKDVPEKCTKTFENLESLRPIMEHKRSAHGYKTTVSGSRGIKIVLRDMPQVAPRVKRLRPKTQARETTKTCTRKCEGVHDFIESYHRRVCQLQSIVKRKLRKTLW
jgi:hypothetical protein